MERDVAAGKAFKSITSGRSQQVGLMIRRIYGCCAAHTTGSRRNKCSESMSCNPTGDRDSGWIVTSDANRTSRPPSTVMGNALSMASGRGQRNTRTSPQRIVGIVWWQRCSQRKGPPATGRPFENAARNAPVRQAPRARDVANKNYILPFMSAGFMSFAAVSSICDVLFIDVA